MPFRNLVVESVSSPVSEGDWCVISVSWEYQGPAITKTIYAAIGSVGILGFDEIVNQSSERSIVAASTYTKQWGSSLIRIPASLSPANSPYDVYAKLIGVDNDVISPTRENILVVEGAAPPPPEERIENLIITSWQTPVALGGSCRVTVSFDYQGPAQTRQLYAALGNAGWAGFDEIIHAIANLSLPETPSLTNRTATVYIPITADIDPFESPYDLYAKINGAFPAAVSPTYTSVVTITGGVPNAEFRNLRITGYTTPVKAGQVCRVDVAFEYQGPAQSRAAYAAIGNQGAFGFDEVLSSSTTISVPVTTSLVTYTASINISITAALDPADSPYDLYAKIDGGIPVATSPTLYNVLTVTGEPVPPDPAIRNLHIISYTSPVGLGDYCVVRVRFEYQGPALGGNVYAAIGSEGFWGFDEVLSNSDSIFLPATVSWTPYEAEVTIAITAGLNEAHSPYDVYAKLTGAVPDTISPTLQDVIVVKAGAGTPEYQNFRVFAYESPVALGATSRITVRCDYRGPAHTRNMRVAIGKTGFFGFNELIVRDVTVNFPLADSWQEQTFPVTMTIVGVDVNDSPFDIYAKLYGTGEDVISPELVGVLGVTGGEPGAGDIVGSLTSVQGTVFEAGKPVVVTVNYHAYTDNVETQVSWQTKVTIIAGSLQGEVIADLFGPETDQSAKVSLGTMPQAAQTGTVVLSGRPASGEWAVLRQQAITINLPGGGGEEPPSGGANLAWVALGLAGVMLLAGGRGEESKPTPKKPKKVK